MAKEKPVKGKESQSMRYHRRQEKKLYQGRSDQLCQMPQIRVNEVGSETGSLDLAIWRPLVTLASVSVTNGSVLRKNMRRGMADNEYNNFREFYCKKETRNGKGVVGRTNGSTEGLYLFFFLKLCYFSTI